MKSVLRMTLSVVVIAVALSPVLAQEKKDDKRVDFATDKALEFLARMQKPDGSWPGNTFNKNSAISGLAVMAFLAKGHTPGEGRYGAYINRGLAHKELGNKADRISGSFSRGD